MAARRSLYAYIRPVALRPYLSVSLPFSSSIGILYRYNSSASNAYLHISI